MPIGQQKLLEGRTVEGGCCAGYNGYDGVTIWLQRLQW